MESEMGESKTVMDYGRIATSLDRMAAQIRECNPGNPDLVFVGIRARGDYLATRLADRVSKAEGRDIPLGALDIGLYRDDADKVIPEVRASEIPGSLEAKVVVLVDDVLFTGRTIRAALDALMNYGRPQKIELAVLVDRGHRELPIQPNYVGLTVETSVVDKVEVNMSEDGKKDSVIIRKK